jgi:predicted phage terminase large subunit-like protein
MLVEDPSLRVVIVSYSEEIARRWGAEIKRDLEEHPELGLKLRADSKAAGRWQLEGHRGGVYCVGIGGSLTSRPVDVLLVDDPVKDMEQARSSAYSERAWRWWQAVALTRLTPGARVAIIQTRWAEDDLAGRVLEHDGDARHGGRWTVLNIPAQAEDDGEDPLGRKPGEYMVSARGNRDWDAVKKAVGTWVWASLYQQSPAPAEGGLFKRLWWRYHTTVGDRMHLGGREYDLRDCWRFATVDLAASTRTSADFTVIAAWARTISGDLVLLDLVRARIGEEQHFTQARPLVQRWNLDTVFVEASQYGTTLVREATQDRVPITPIQAESDKFSRALPYSAWVSSGRVWLPSGAHWLDAFVNEHAAFPAAAHDDTVDVGSMAVRVAVTKWQPPPTGPASRPASSGEVDLMSAAM